MPRLSFRYRHLGTHYQFSLEAPYSEGHTITRAEAQALNQLRLENVRENCRPAFAKEAGSLAIASDLLSDEALERVQQAVDQYDQEYQFKEILEHSPKLGAVEKEALILARSRLSDEASEQEIEILASTIDLLAEARERVEIRNKVTSAAMEELL